MKENKDFKMDDYLLFKKQQEFEFSLKEKRTYLALNCLNVIGLGAIIIIDYLNNTVSIMNLADAFLLSVLFFHVIDVHKNKIRITKISFMVSIFLFTIIIQDIYGTIL